MYLSKLFFLLASASLATLVLSVPVPQDANEESLEIIERASTVSHPLDEGVYLRALTAQQKGQRAATVIQKQHNRKQAKQARGARNNAIAANLAATKPARKQAHKAVKASRKGMTADARKASVKQSKDAAMGIRNAAKLQRKQAHEAKMATKRPKAPKTPRTPRRKAADPDRADVKAHIKTAAQNMQNMQGIPDRGYQFQYKNHAPTSGRDVRQAVMNGHLHTASPVGNGYNTPLPKTFENRPYRIGHPYRGRGRRPLPNSPAWATNLKEYPVLPGAGYHGNANVGAVRVITDNGANSFHGVTTHANVRGGRAGDHYEKTR